MSTFVFCTNYFECNNFLETFDWDNILKVQNIETVLEKLYDIYCRKYDNILRHRYICAYELDKK